MDDDLDIPPHGWLVVACKGGWEDKARKELESQTYSDGRSYEVFLPWCIVPRTRRGKYIESREPLFPCYVFLAKHVGVSLEELQLGAIKSTRGVIGIVSVTMGGLPNMIAHRFVDAIRRRCDEEGGAWRFVPPAPVGKSVWREGEQVRLESSVLGTHVGLVESLCTAGPDDRVRIMLACAAGKLTFSVPASDLRRIAS